VRSVMTELRPRTGIGFWVKAGAALAREPGLWSTAAGQAGRLARPAWWRRAPFLPLPDPAYVRFRLDTQYGSSGAPDPQDLVVYLRWCKAEGRR
jgi:hypothetical protein